MFFTWFDNGEIYVLLPCLLRLELTAGAAVLPLEERKEIVVIGGKVHSQVACTARCGEAGMSGAQHQLGHKQKIK